MKKWLFGIVLAVSVLCCACACAETQNFGGAFEVTYPDTWKLDRQFGATENTDDFQVLGAFETFASVLEMSISDDREYYEDFTLPVSMNSDYYTYLAELMSMLEQAEDTQHCEFVKGMTNGDGKVMFLIFYADDGDGGYYYADTMLGGCTLLFYAYSDHDMLPAGARQLAELETLLTGITFSDALFQ